MLRDPKRRWFLVSAAAVLVLAAAFFAFSALSPREIAEEPPTERSPSLAEQASKFVAAAEAALRSGDTTGAAALLERAAEIDPDNEGAKARLKQVRAGRPDGSPDGEDDPSDDPAGEPPPPVEDPDEGFTGTLGDMREALPSSVPGYSSGTPVADEANAAVSFDPTADGPYGIVARLLVSVHDRGSAGAADAFVDDVSKVAYPLSARSVTADGVPAYFGTDGRRMATVSFARGRYAFELVMTSSSVEPEALRTLLLEAARALPDTLP